LFDAYVLVEWVPSETLVQRHKGRSAEQECVLRTHRASVVECRRDHEPSQPLALHVGCDGHSPDAYHLCPHVTDRNRQPQQAGMGHKPVAVSDPEVFFFGQPGQTGRGNTEGVIAVAEDLVLLRPRVPREPRHSQCYRGLVVRHPSMMISPRRTAQAVAQPSIEDGSGMRSVHGGLLSCGPARLRATGTRWGRPGFPAVVRMRLPISSLKAIAASLG
jgi:hypothetical protein